MYFEPSKKTYYRFPSAKSVAKMDKRMYFPEKPAHASDDSHYDYSSNSFMPEREHNYDFK
ncbi:MAG: hypothetical protein EWM47_02920 [Anaerolineaceae bacterium]|nr:MAG: hypothetical protein EWM47_02920 [Anaerolineaceae bacterium]